MISSFLQLCYNLTQIYSMSESVQSFYDKFYIWLTKRLFSSTNMSKAGDSPSLQAEVS